MIRVYPPWRSLYLWISANNDATTTLSYTYPRACNDNVKSEAACQLQERQKAAVQQ